MATSYEIHGIVAYLKQHKCRDCEKRFKSRHTCDVKNVDADRLEQALRNHQATERSVPPPGWGVVLGRFLCPDHYSLYMQNRATARARS